MKKLHKFGQYLIVFNFAYCLVMAAIESFNHGGYIFTSEYFYGGSLLMILAMNTDLYIRKSKMNQMD